jgi:hypothetical protein
MSANGSGVCADDHRAQAVIANNYKFLAYIELDSWINNDARYRTIYLRSSVARNDSLTHTNESNRFRLFTIMEPAVDASFGVELVTDDIIQFLSGCGYTVDASNRRLIEVFARSQDTQPSGYPRTLMLNGKEVSVDKRKV